MEKESAIKFSLTSKQNGVCLMINDIVIAPQQVIAEEGSLYTFLINPEMLRKRLPESAKYKTCRNISNGEYGPFHCSECDHIPAIAYEPYFCPRCGAKVIKS